MTLRRVLVSAYACNPSSSRKLHPGEDQVGWRMVRQIAKDNDVWVLCHAYNRPGVEEALSREPLPNVRFRFLDLPRPVWLLYKVGFGERIYYYLWQIRAWREARRLHREVGFDLAHHLTFGNDWIGSWIGAFLPVPFVWGPVGGGHATPPALYAEYTPYGRFAERARNTAQWFGRRDPVRRRSVRRARALLVCNRETRDRLPGRFQAKTQFFPVNGIGREDLSPDAAIPRRAPAEPFRVLTAGRLHRLKGFGLAVRAFAKFAKTHPNAEFLIVGDGPESGRLDALIRAEDPAGRIRRRDWLPRTEVLEEMRRAHAFLFPSFRDGGGAVVVEAMAQGLPVIVLDTAGPGFHVEPGWGIKVTPDSPERVVEGLAGALETLAADEAGRERLGRSARRRAEEFYLWDRLGERMNRIYDGGTGGAA